MGKLIEEWKSAAAGTVEVDWAAVEQELGFAVHENLRDYYSRVLGGKGRRCVAEGIIKFDPKAFIKENVSKKDWLADINEINGGRAFCEFELFPLAENGTEYVRGFFKEAFIGDWTAETTLDTGRT